MAEGGVKFIRVRGRVVPLKDGGGAKKQKPVKVGIGVKYSSKKISAGQRFKTGASVLGGVGALFGAALAADTAKTAKSALRLGAAGAVAGGIGLGLIGGGFAAAFGARRVLSGKAFLYNQKTGKEIDLKKLKKKSGGSSV